MDISIVSTFIYSVIVNSAAMNIHIQVSIINENILFLKNNISFSLIRLPYQYTIDGVALVTNLLSHSSGD